MAATLIIRDGTNTARTITALLVRDGGNVQRTITELWVRDANNVPRLVFDPTGAASLAVSIAPSSRIGTSMGTGTATTAAVTATPSGGTGPYTYAWTLLSDDGPVDPTANSPTSAATTFTQTSMDPAGFYTSQWQCEVTDSLAASATDTCTANFLDTT